MNKDIEYGWIKNGKRYKKLRDLLEDYNMVGEVKPGTQIAYVPMHAKGNLKHTDVQFGFVVKDVGDDCFCRYFNKEGGLRTLANSERTPKHLLKVTNSRPQEEVDLLLDWITNGQ